MGRHIWHGTIANFDSAPVEDLVQTMMLRKVLVQELQEGSSDVGLYLQVKRWGIIKYFPASLSSSLPRWGVVRQFFFEIRLSEDFLVFSSYSIKFSLVAGELRQSSAGHFRDLFQYIRWMI